MNLLLNNWDLIVKSISKKNSFLYTNSNIEHQKLHVLFRGEGGGGGDVTDNTQMRSSIGIIMNNSWKKIV